MFTSKLKITGAISIAIIVIGVIVTIASGGLNLGIDFTGGSLVSIDMGSEFDTEDIQEVLTKYDAADSPIVKAGDNYTEAVIRMKEADEETQTETASNIVADVQQTYTNAELISVDRVGGTTSSDLIRDAFLSILVAAGLMLIYIWIRFELFNGVAAVITLAHDVLIMISVVAMTRMQINSGFIAACLTIVGYSINNTIVIFDRIRDNQSLPRYSQVNRDEFADISIKETLTRTINTTVTTLIMIVSLYIFGVDSIREFSFPIIIGLLAGVYSSVFLAAPLWAAMSDRAEGKTQPKRKKERKAANA